MDTAAPLLFSPGSRPGTPYPFLRTFTSPFNPITDFMNRHTTAAALFAMLAMSVPMVSYAQDPAGLYKQIQALAAKGQHAQGIELCDKILTTYGEGKSRMSKQFAYMMPFFLWQKASMQSATKDYKAAYNTFKELYTSERYKDKALIEVSISATGQPEGYAPFLTASLFQMGYNRFMDGVGTDAAPGDQAMFEEAIPALEEYLGLLRSGKVSNNEKKQKLEGKVSFLLLQSYLLKKEPDFKKAEEYLTMSGKSKEKLPDDMAMTGLSTIVNVALKNPQYVGWVGRVIASNPGSYSLSPDRASRHASTFLNAGIKAAAVSSAALKKNDLETAAAAAQSATQLFGMLPDVPEVREVLKANVAALGKFDRPVADPATGTRLLLREQQALLRNYDKLAKQNTQIEAFATLTMANNALAFGSNRLGKAGYQLAVDRYPRLAQVKKDGESTPMIDKNVFQLSQLCHVTGDEEAAVKLEKRLEKSGSDVGSKNIKVNHMARLVKAQDWENVVPAADEVIAMYKSDPTNQAYASAFFSKVAALYKLGRYVDVAEQGTELLNSGCLVAGTGSGKLNEKQVKTYGSQANFFVMDSYNKLGKEDRTCYDKAMESFEMFVKNYPSMDLKENSLAANAYYTAIDTLLKRRGHGDDAANEKDMAMALEYCKVIADNWKESPLYPTAQLLRGSILINGTDEAVKPEGIAALEACAEGGLAQPDGKGLTTAANALYWLASYSPEIPREGEDEAALAARVKGYSDTFWAKADQAGNPYSLQMATLELRRAVRERNAEAYNAAIKRAQEVITREANHAFSQNKVNAEMEATINDYATAYIDGNKALNSKEMTLEEKTEHFTNFPGINEGDKYTRAILRMALINSMNAELTAAGDDTEKRNKINQDVEKTFREMTNAFKPEDLTNFICVQVGNYLVNYVSRFDNPASKTEELAQAEAYFGAVIKRGREQVEAARLGRANAMALTGDSAKQAEALKEYDTLAQSRDRAVSGPALVGSTKLYMNMGDANKAVEMASKFIADRGNTTGRLDMLMLLGQAYEKAGNQKDALLTFMNLYNQNIGNVTYSAPACVAMTEIMWKRNNPTSGDRMKGTFKQSDRWQAWNTAQDYVTKLRRSGFEEKMSRSDKDLFQKVVQAAARYGADAAVQKEEKERRDFQSRLKSSPGAKK